MPPGGVGRPCVQEGHPLGGQARGDLRHHQAAVRALSHPVNLPSFPCSQRDGHRVREAFEDSLAALDIGYIDLYLMHWPQATNDKG